MNHRNEETPQAQSRQRRRRIAKGLASLIAVVAVIAAIASQTESGRVFMQYLRAKVRGGHTVESRLDEFASKCGEIPRPFAAPESAAVQTSAAADRGPLSIVVFKDQRRLTLYEQDPRGTRQAVLAEHPILGLSGQLGPKLKEGDRQVPEGIYEIEWLNPVSRFHVSMRLNYPNAFDRAKASSEGRTNLGGDIMIHGSTGSAGCLAMGDDVVERLFYVVGRNQGRCRVIVAPTDLRVNPKPTGANLPSWTPELYQHIQEALAVYPSK